MSARSMRLAVLIASVVSVTNAVVLNAQPSTDRLADVSDTRPRIGIDVGGTYGPLTPFQQVTANSPRLDQLAMLTYLVKSRDRYAVRAAVWVFQSDKRERFSEGSTFEAQERRSDRAVSIGGLVDMFNKSLGSQRFRNVHVVGSLGAGLVPFATNTTELSGTVNRGFHSYRNESGVGAHAGGSVGLRWKWLAVDQHIFGLLTSGVGLSAPLTIPFTMGVRF